MKGIVIAACCLLAAGAVSAKIMGTVDSETGRIDLHDEQGQCAGKALRAEYVPVEGEKIQGCWVTGGPFVLVVFLDADIARIPVAMIRPPTAA